MKITRVNYELFFINYFDGNLSPDEIDELMLFLKVNPDLEDELLNFQNIDLSNKEEVHYENKNNLKKTISDKKSINSDNINEFLIAYIEKDLSALDKARVEKFLKENPGYKKSLYTFRKTVLVPDLSVTFFDKKTLKKKAATKEFRIKYFYYTIAAAAALILFFFNIFFSDVHLNRNGMGLASKDTFLEAGMSHNLFSDSSQNTNEKKSVEHIKKYINNQNIETDEFKAQPFIKMSQKNAGLLLLTNNTPSSILGIRDEFSNIYNYKQTVEYNEINENDYSDIIPDKPRESFISYAVSKIFTSEQKVVTSDNTSKKVDIWKIIDIGTYGINAIAKNNLIDLSRKKENNTVKIDFALGGNVIYSRTSRLK